MSWWVFMSLHSRLLERTEKNGSGDFAIYKPIIFQLWRSVTCRKLARLAVCKWVFITIIPQLRLFCSCIARDSSTKSTLSDNAHYVVHSRVSSWVFSFRARVKMKTYKPSAKGLAGAQRMELRWFEGCLLVWWFRIQLRMEKKLIKYCYMFSSL